MIFPLLQGLDIVTIAGEYCDPLKFLLPSDVSLVMLAFVVVAFVTTFVMSMMTVPRMPEAL